MVLQKLASVFAIFCSVTVTVAAHAHFEPRLISRVSTYTNQIINKTSSPRCTGNVLHDPLPGGRSSHPSRLQFSIPTDKNCAQQHTEARQLFQADGDLGCQLIPGYTAYAGIDHPGNDLICTKSSAEVLAARCNSLPWCVSFNTDGCLKWKQNTTGTNDKNGFCFYVKDVSMECPAVPGFDVQQARAYNDMTAEGDISIGRGCFRHLSIAQLAHECQTDINCNAFDSWGCIKNYTFLNDNGLGPSYCFYTKQEGVKEIPYCLEGWYVPGNDIGQIANVTNITECQAACSQNPDCTYIVWDPQSQMCSLKKDLMNGAFASSATTTLCTRGQPTCSPIEGFRPYFGRVSLDTWPNTCGRNTAFSVQQSQQFAAECLATPGCAGFDPSGCLALNPAVEDGLVVNCFYERTNFSSSLACAAVPGYTLYTGYDHDGYTLEGSCFRDQTIDQTAQDCNATPDCAAFNSFNCLIVGNNSTVNYNGRSDDFCFYFKDTIQNLPQLTRQPGQSNEGSTNECEAVPGYTAYPRSDHPGDDLPGPNCINASVQSLAAKCNDIPWCVSFNTDGCLKYKETTTAFNKTEGSCFYTKNVVSACPHIPGFFVQQGRGYNDMTAEGDISIGRECFRNISIAQLAHECQTDVNCNAFDSWGCLKNYTFLNDNGLGPSYCFYTKEGGGTADATPYCIKGWDVIGTNVGTYSKVIDLVTCQQLCWQNPACTFSVWNEVTLECYTKQDMLFGKEGANKREDVLTFCTKGIPTCPSIPGFCAYFSARVDGTAWPSTCNRNGLSPLDIALQCQGTPGCAGFDVTGCVTFKSAINSRGIPTCFWERVYYQPGTCTEVPGYTALPPGFDHVGDDLVGTCGRNQTILETAEGCNAALSCTAINSNGCLKLGGNVSVNDNSLSNNFCYYLKSIHASPPPQSTVLASPRPLPLPQDGNVDRSPAKHKSTSVGAIAGIAIGSAVGLLAILLLMWRWTRKQEHYAHSHTHHLHDQAEVVIHMAQKVADIPGLIKGEVFTRATAHEYNWTEATTFDSLTAVTSDNEDELALSEAAGPAIELTSQEVKEQIQLLKHGFLGRGATALVFKGLWPSRFGDSALVAVKVLQNGHGADLYTMNSFAYEAGVLTSLYPPHPNVIRLYGYCLEPPTVCLILEVLPGSLKNKLYPKPLVQNTPQVLEVNEETPQDQVPAPSSSSHRNVQVLPNDQLQHDSSLEIADNAEGPAASICLSMGDVLQISIDIVTGLKYLHDLPLAQNAVTVDIETLTLDSVQPPLPLPASTVLLASPATQGPFDNKGRKIVHRDLKPANILLDTAGRAKISDFGLARCQLQDTMETRNLAAGTLPYMAPELLVAKQIHSARFHATNRVDIYSMGMIMWEMLAGRVPWAHMHEHAMYNEVLSGRRPELPSDQQDDQPVMSLSEMPASLHALPEFNNIIRACWNQREHQRPSAAALYGMLMSLRDKYK